LYNIIEDRYLWTAKEVIDQMPYEIKKVEHKEDIDTFHELPFRLYREYPEWSPPFRFEVENIFNPDSNPFYEQGECERFLVYDNERAAARFAMMHVPERDRMLDPPMAGIGFIEMENSRELAQTIIRFAEKWSKKRGYSAMRGPVNFGENDTFWGLLVENYDDPPAYGMFYHPPYYKKLLEETGARKLDDLYSYKRSFTKPLPERLLKIVDRIESRESVSFRPIDTGNLHRDAEYIRQIYNQAWGNQEITEREEEFTELDRETVQRMVDKLKPVLIPESNLIAFINGEPVSFIVSIPDLNELSRKTGGKLKWWHLPRMLWFKRRASRLRVIAFGTVPKYRKMGLEALIFVRGIQGTHDAAPRLEYLEGGWVSEKNWLMQRSLEALGCIHYKTHRTYKWEF